MPPNRPETPRETSHGRLRLDAPSPTIPIGRGELSITKPTLPLTPARWRSQSSQSPRLSRYCRPSAPGTPKLSPSCRISPHPGTVSTLLAVATGVLVGRWCGMTGALCSYPQRPMCPLRRRPGPQDDRLETAGVTTGQTRLATATASWWSLGTWKVAGRLQILHVRAGGPPRPPHRPSISRRRAAWYAGAGARGRPVRK